MAEHTYKPGEPREKLDWLAREGADLRRHRMTMVIRAGDLLLDAVDIARSLDVDQSSLLRVVKLDLAIHHHCVEQDGAECRYNGKFGYVCDGDCDVATRLLREHAAALAALSPEILARVARLSEGE